MKITQEIPHIQLFVAVHWVHDYLVWSFFGDFLRKKTLGFITMFAPPFGRVLLVPATKASNMQIQDKPCCLQHQPFEKPMGFPIHGSMGLGILTATCIP